MGILVQGRWQADDALPRSASGEFVRADSAFRSAVTADGSSAHPAEAHRYHLYVAYGCPWAHRTILYRILKGLEAVIGISYADMGREGWTFRDDNLPLWQVYTAAKSDYTGRVTVPVLWDKKAETIVNNESSEIIRMLDSQFDALGARGPRLYPADRASEIDALNAEIYSKLNNGVYRAGFARTQEAYDAAVRDVFSMLDALEERLGGRRFLLGDEPLEADWRLFPTLVRFDVAYYTAFKCNRRRLDDYPRLSRYVRELYRRPGIAETVHLDLYRRGYHSIPVVNPSGIVPVGPLVDFS